LVELICHRCFTIGPNDVKGACGPKSYISVKIEHI
jgi:hypothetical protein